MQWCLVVLGVFFSVICKADAAQNVIELLQYKQSSIHTLQQAIKQGKERAILCGYCHGKDGNSVKEYIPNLAGQHPEYLVTQFEAFSQGNRYNYVMAKLAKNLSAEERVNLALYYSSLQVQSTTATNSTDREAGKVIFANRCVACHGQAGLGHKSLPRLAGQPGEFIANALNAFKKRERGLPGSPMPEIAVELTKQDISAIAAYITSM